MRTHDSVGIALANRVLGLESTGGSFDVVEILMEPSDFKELQDLAKLLLRRSISKRGKGDL